MKYFKASILAIALGVATFHTTPVNAFVLDANQEARRNIFFAAANPDGDTAGLPTTLPQLTLFSAKLVAPTSCKGNIGLSIVDAFSDGTIKRIYENFTAVVKQLASADGAIFLASLYISKSNPNLYQLLTEGISLGVTDYLSAMGSCEKMAEALVDAADPLIEMQQSTKLNQLIETNAKTAVDEEWNDIKVEDIVGGGMDYLAEHGIELNGERVGGADQNPINITDSFIKYGWCIYRGLKQDECESYYKSEKKKIPGITDKVDLILSDISSTDKQNALNLAAIHILGNKYISICNGCETVTVEAKGAVDWLKADQQAIAVKIEALAAKPISQLDTDDFNSVGWPPAITVNESYFRNLNALSSDSDTRAMFIYGWAFDVAYQRTEELLDVLKQSLLNAKANTDIEDAKLTGELESLMEKLKDQRELLHLYAKRHNYTPLMYIHELLTATDKLAGNKVPGLINPSTLKDVN